MKTNNLYTDLILNAWEFVKKVSIGIVSALPAGKAYTTHTSTSRMHSRNEEIITGPDKYYHRPRSKPAVEKQTLLKEVKKPRKHV